MILDFSGHFLFAGLFLTVSALTEEECRPLTTPLSLADPSVWHGRLNVFVGYTNSDAFNAILKKTDSTWLNTAESPDHPGHVVMTEENKINGSCFTTNFYITVEGNSATAHLGSVTSVSQMFPSCDGCVVLFANSTSKNMDDVLDVFHVNVSRGEPVNALSLYLMGRESTPKDSDVEHFKQQASCFGFSGEPDFHHDPKKEFCKEGEGVPMDF